MIDAIEPFAQTKPLRTVTTPWPALVALAIVVALAITMLAVDLGIDRRTADQTEMLVENSLRSVALADDLRHQAYRLSTAHLTPEQIASIAEQIDVDARAYAPIADSPGEGAEWNRLESLLAHLRHEQPLLTSGSPGNLFAEIETSIGRLVEINQSEARRSARTIADLHHGGIVIDTIFGALTLVLAALVALALLRALRRQRTLLRVHLASLDERASELAAFAGRASHDLMGPLSPIRGYADMLSMHSAPEVRESARRITRSVERMTSLIHDLLDLSVHGKPAAGTTAITPTVFEVIEDLHEQLDDAEVIVELGNFAAACSAGVLAQALRNVVSNAAKYRSPSRRLTLRIEARNTGKRVALAIADNGIGMDAETAAHVFEPLYRARGVTVPGHGLGLAIVRRTIEAIGGVVKLDSQVDTGTRVTLELPPA